MMSTLAPLTIAPWASVTVPRTVPRNDCAAAGEISTDFSPVILLKNLHGDHQLLERVTRLFKENAPNCLREMRRAMHARDSEVLQKSAHSLLSSLELFGAYHARDLARSLRLASRSENFDKAAALLVELQEEIDRVCSVCAESSSAAETFLLDGN